MFLRQLDAPTYTAPMEEYNGSTLGQQTRHAIEFMQCLADTKDGLVCYDHRARDTRIEEDPLFASEHLANVAERLSQLNLDEKVSLKAHYDHIGNVPYLAHSTIGRELVHVIEHAIHHLALLKIGLRRVAPQVELPADFGIAPSTIQHQSKCAP